MSKNKYFILITLACLFLSIKIINSQIWIRVNGPYTSTINTISFGTSNNSYMGSDGNMNAAGFFKTTNFGLNWSKIYSWGGAAVLASAILPSNAIYISSVLQGILYSTNEGSAWNQTGLSGATSFSITSNNYIFAGGNFYGIYRTIGIGSGWVRVNPDNYTFKVLDRTSTDVIYAGTPANGIFKSTNYGNNWINVWDTSVSISCLSTKLTGRVLAGTQKNGLYMSYFNIDTLWTKLTSPFDSIYALTVTSSNKIFVGSEKGIYWSIDSGLTWILSDSNFVKDIRNLAVNNMNYVFAGTENGIFKSTNSGVNWSNIGLIYNTVDKITIASDDNIYCVTFNAPTTTYLWRSSDYGYTWFREYKTNTGIRCLKGDNLGNIYMATSYGLYFSANKGKSWIFKGLVSSTIDIIKINSIGHIFAAGSNKVYRSTDGGINWTEIQPENTIYKSMAIDGNNNIYTGTQSSNIWKSTNNGNNWTLSVQINPLHDILNLECGSPGYVFACAYGMYRTSNDGSTWTNMNNFTPADMKVNSIGTVFFSAGVVYKSTNNLETFEEFNTGLNSVHADRFAVSPSDYLYACTSINGLFKTAIPTDIISYSSKIPVADLLLQNYPNPFNPSTKIKFDLTAGEKNNNKITKLIIYDVQGKEITKLINESLRPGTYEAEWNASNYPSGIYFVRLTAGEYSGTIKIILMK